MDKNNKELKYKRWKQPTINKIRVSSTKGGNKLKNNESLTADHYTFGGAGS